MKILCLHGFRHSSKSLKKYMDALINKFSKYDIEFDFYQSPIKYIPTSDEINSGIDCNDYYQWWSTTRENFLLNEHYDTINESLNNLTQKWKSENYDGILGFSQGSVLVQLFVYKIELQQIVVYEPKFIILVSPFIPSDIDFIDYNKTIKNIKTIIISGAKDTLVPTNISLSLIKQFSDARFLLHSGGHYVSSSTEIMYPLLKILQSFKNTL